MAAAPCGSLQHIFVDNSLPENPTLLDSLSSFKQLQSLNPVDESSSLSSFSEIFGELRFKENNDCHHHLLTALSTPSLFENVQSADKNERDGKRDDVVGEGSRLPFPSMNRGSTLSLCTEGLGFESSDDVEDGFDWISNNNNKGRSWERAGRHGAAGIERRSRGEAAAAAAAAFPPPISCIGRSGKPWVWFNSYRQEGRFILEEIRIPTHEFLHACREGGRLRLQFVSSDDGDEIPEEDEEDDDDDDDDETAREGEENIDEESGGDGASKEDGELIGTGN